MADTSLNFITLHPHNMRELLKQEALRWVGVQEENGNNKGQLVEIFQRSVSLEPGQAWCAAFVIYCLDRVKAQAMCLDQYAPVSKVHRTGHVVTMWENTPLGNRVSAFDALPGDLVLWRKVGTDSGHIGILLSINGANGIFSSCEGNTGPGVQVERDGEGVFIKNRLLGGYGTLSILGFIRPWV